MSGDNTVTYGDVDVTNHVQADGGNVKGEMRVDPAVRLWDHRLVFRDDGVECRECEMEEDLPELLQMSSGFRQVVWKLYILGKFKDKSCVRKIRSENVVGVENTIAYDRDMVSYLSNSTTIPNRKI